MNDIEYCAGLELLNAAACALRAKYHGNRRVAVVDNDRARLVVRRFVMVHFIIDVSGDRARLEYHNARRSSDAIIVELCDQDSVNHVINFVLDRVAELSAADAGYARWGF